MTAQASDTDEAIFSPNAVRAEALIVDAELDSWLVPVRSSHIYEGEQENKGNKGTHRMYFSN